MEDKSQIGQLFDRIAGTYDRFNHILSLNIDKSWRRRTIRKMRPADSLLDVAIGTGDLAIRAVRDGKAAQVKGLDLSAEMMRIGAEKAEKAGLEEKIEFLQGSALQMPFDDSTFDAVSCAFGVRNFSDLDKGLREMFRVLKPGGQLLILEFSYPENRIMRAAYDFFFTRIMPVVGKKISHDAGAYIYFKESVKGFIWGEEMLVRIREAGFENASFKTLTFGIATLYTADKK